MKKGQIAIEYLATYGWAILLLVIVVGILMSMMSPSMLVSEQCNIDQNNLPCNAQLYDSDAGDLVLLVKVRNGFGYPIKIKRDSINITMDKEWDAVPSIELKKEGNVVNGDYVVLHPGEDGLIIESTFGKAKQPGEIETFSISVGYVSCAKEINPECSENSEVHTKSGKIIQRVIK